MVGNMNLNRTVSADAGPGGAGVLMLCTANVCRSPMAAALLARRLAKLGARVPVTSAGRLTDGAAPDPVAVAVMARYGLDISGHASRAARQADLRQAGLILAMSRENLRFAVVAERGAWPRAFTLAELVRRAGLAGPRRPGEPLGAWLARVAAGRQRAELLGDSPSDDVADPAGGPQRGYAETAALLDVLTARLAELGWAGLVHTETAR
jgi:protein-tyrosine phosphatase